MEVVKRGRGRPRKNTESQLFLVPVQWTVAGQFLVRANSLQQAIKAVEEDQDLFPFENAQSEYVDDSFEVNKSCCCTIRETEIPLFNNQQVISLIQTTNEPSTNEPPTDEASTDEFNIESLVSEEPQPIDGAAVVEESDEGFDEPIPKLIPPNENNGWGA